MNRHDRRKAGAMGKAIPMTPEEARDNGFIIQSMQDAMGVIATLVKMLGGEVAITSDDLVHQYTLAEERIPRGFKLKLNEISRKNFEEITGEERPTH